MQHLLLTVQICAHFIHIAQGLETHYTTFQTMQGMGLHWTHSKALAQLPITSPFLLFTQPKAELGPGSVARAV